MTRIETFAEHHRLKVTRDECNDQVIQGRRGQLYFDGEAAIRSKWKELSGNLWMGDISPHPNTGKRVQDVKITNIPPENARAGQEITVDQYTEGRGDAARNVKRVKIKLADKQGALNSLAKHLGMFTDRMRVEVTDSIAQAMARAAKRLRDANLS